MTSIRSMVLSSIATTSEGIGAAPSTFMIYISLRYIKTSRLRSGSYLSVHPDREVEPLEYPVQHPELLQREYVLAVDCQRHRRLQAELVPGLELELVRPVGYVVLLYVLEQHRPEHVHAAHKLHGAVGRGDLAHDYLPLEEVLLLDGYRVPDVLGHLHLGLLEVLKHFLPPPSASSTPTSL